MGISRKLYRRCVGKRSGKISKRRRHDNANATENFQAGANLREIDAKRLVCAAPVAPAERLPAQSWREDVAII